jgi:hypothetical protein
MNFFNAVFEKMNLFDTSCEYKSKCALYKSDSYICTKEVDKSCCGIYRQFVQKNEGVINRAEV